MEQRTTVRADDGTQLAVRVRGDGARRLLFVHGWMASSAAWEPLLPLLDFSGLTAAFVDLRGTGASDKPASGYTLARHQKDLLTVVDALGWSRFAAVGHSMGGQLSQALGVELSRTDAARLDGLFLLCPVPQRGVALPPEAVALFSTAGGDRGKLKTILKLATRDITDARLQQLLDDALSIPAACINECFSAFHAGFAGDLATIRARTLVVGSEDPFLPVPLLQEAIATRIPGARFAVLPGAGHYPQHERPHETAALLEAFLAGLGA